MPKTGKESDEDPHFTPWQNIWEGTEIGIGPMGFLGK